MHIPKILRPFLKLTAEEKTPTDIELDSDIEYVSFVMHGLWPLLSKIIRNKIRRFFRYRWKFILGRIVIATGICVLGYYAFIKVFSVQIVHVTNNIAGDTCTYYRNDSSMNLRNFLLQIAYGESRYIKHAHRDSSQYWGLYQIGTNERKLTGFADIPMSVYLNHPEIQDLCMIELLKYNKKYMQGYIDKYSGKIVDGILVTESGILALCQLGSGSTRLWLDSGKIPSVDEFGNSPRNLLKIGGYDLKLNDVRYSIQDAVNGKPTIK